VLKILPCEQIAGSYENVCVWLTVTSPIPGSSTDVKFGYKPPFTEDHSNSSRFVVNYYWPLSYLMFISL